MYMFGGIRSGKRSFHDMGKVQNATGLDCVFVCCVQESIRWYRSSHLMEWSCNNGKLYQVKRIALVYTYFRFEGYDTVLSNFGGNKCEDEYLEGAK